MKDKSLDVVLKVFLAAGGITMLALFWLKPAAVPEMILVALAIWLVVSKFARPGREKKPLPVEVDIKR
ncbi:MAG: hypothetical protein V1823_03880 [Chloroflexota bacterium]